MVFHLCAWQRDFVLQTCRQSLHQTLIWVVKMGAREHSSLLLPPVHVCSGWRDGLFLHLGFEGGHVVAPVPYMSKAPSWQVRAFGCLVCTKSSVICQRRANVLEKGNPAWLDGDTWLYCHLVSCSKRESIILACPHMALSHLLLSPASREVGFSCVKH